jgi:hypothetical protein
MPKISIRNSVFETNSSSTHSISLCSDKDYAEWVKGETYFYESKDIFIKEDEIIPYLASEEYRTVEELTELKNTDPEEFDSLRREDGIKTYEEYFDINNDYGGYFDTFVERFTTVSGDKVVAFGIYGYDG